MPLVDLSHTVEHGMTTYPGLPGPAISDHMSFADSRDHYAPGTSFSIGRIDMVANTGTYLDTPAHRYADGVDLAGLPLEKCCLLPVLVVDVPPEGPVPVTLLDGLDVRGRAVLLRSGWDRHWRTERYGDAAHPHLDAAGARALEAAALVGTDSVNVDDTRGGERPAHTLLLGAGIPVVEHLTRLGSVPDTGARFTAAPVAVRGMGTFPVRAFASWE